MAMPNRHIALGGMFGCLLYKLIGGPAGIITGAVVALLSHIPIDLAFDEAWYWKPDEERSNAIALGLLIIGMAVPMIHFFSWWAVLFAVASVLPDIIDDGMYAWTTRPGWVYDRPWIPIFPTHFRSQPWHFNQWFLTESKMTTLMWEVNSSGAVIVILGIIYFVKAH
jgi:hypothetical protein